MAKLVHFLRDYDYRVSYATEVAYPAHFDLVVPDDHADEAIRVGAAELLRDLTPKKPKAEEEKATDAPRRRRS